MIYTDYQYYKEVFYGGKIKNEGEFNGLAVKATADLNTLTFNRIDLEKPIINEVKNAMCAIVEVRKAYEMGEAGIASASIGNKSVSYANVEGKTLEKEVRKAAEPFLSGTGLLYRGFYSGERK